MNLFKLLRLHPNYPKQQFHLFIPTTNQSIISPTIYRSLIIEKEDNNMNKLHLRNKTLPNNISTQTTILRKTANITKLPSNSLIKTQHNLPTFDRVPINDYINIMKKTNTTPWGKESKQNVPMPWIHQLKNKDVDKNFYQRMSQIVIKRRKMKFSYEHKDIDLFKKHGMSQIIEAIVGCYEYYQKFGYSSSKITSIVRFFCEMKRDLQWIFLKKINSQLTSSQFAFQYRSKPSQIKSKIGYHKTSIIRDVITFKNKLEEDLVNKGKDRIIQIKDSIEYQKRQINSRIQFPQQNSCLAGLSRTYHKSLTQEHLSIITDVDEFSQAFKSQSRVNRLLYKHFNTLFKYN